MNPFAISGLLIAFTSSLFGLLVLLKSQNKKQGRIWFLFCITVTIWGLCDIGLVHARNYHEAVNVLMIAYVTSIIWMPVLFYHFICVFLGLKHRISILTQYAIGLIFASLTPTGLFLKPVWVFNSFYYGSSQPIFPFYALWWMALVFYSHYELIRAFRSSSSHKRNQIKYVFLATAIGYTGGSLCYLPNFGIMLYPWGNFAVPLYPMIMSYAILRYQLMDIKVVIRRAGLITLIYAALASVLVPIGWSLYPKIAISRWGFPLSTIACGAVLSIGPFLYAYLIRKSSFFQERVVSGVTHEFKSPLASIQCATEVLREEMKKVTEGKPFESSQEKIADYLLMIQNNSQRLEKFIHELLQISKIEQGEPELKLEETNLNDVCQRAIEMYRPIAEQKGILLEFLPNGSELVRCDADKIEIAVSNLLSNAMKFTNQGRIKVQIYANKGGAEISVEDTGVGIPTDDLPYIFDKFYQGKNGNNSKGTGLGLALVKGWIEAHGGRINAENMGGKGSRISFTLPL